MVLGLMGAENKTPQPINASGGSFDLAHVNDGDIYYPLNVSVIQSAYPYNTSPNALTCILLLRGFCNAAPKL
jgi:hypothetical protein